MGFCNTTFVLILLSLLSLLINHLCISDASNQVLCISSERQALLQFKQHLFDPSGRLASWSEKTNCCNWTSVVCDNITGHVIQLHLRTSPPYADETSGFDSEIHPSILDLKHLSYLDLSGNGFGNMQIPSFLGSLKSLTYLNLSNSRLGGSIPHQIANLSSLIYLDLGGNDFIGNIPNQIGNLSSLHYLHLEGGYDPNMDKILFFSKGLQWLSSLSSLKYLQLSYVNLSNAFDWLHVLHSLPSLKELHLTLCALHHYFDPTVITNLTYLEILDLSDSHDFGASSIPRWIFQLKILVSLQLRGNYLKGFIPYGIQNLTFIEDLDLSYNAFNNSIPEWLYSLNRLKSLSLSSNKLNGSISDGIQNLTFIENLDLSGNAFDNSIPEWLYSLNRLKSLSLSLNKLNGSISDGIQNLTFIENLDLSGNAFDNSIPESLYSLNRLKSLSLSSNKLNGSISKAIGKLTSLVTINLSDNQFEGPIPSTLGNICSLKSVYFSSNKLNQQISEILPLISGCASNTLESLSIFNSKLYGHLTSQIGSFKNLFYLDLSDNFFVGEIPKSLGNLTSLNYLNLYGNQFNGNPFDVIRSLSTLQLLNIGDNLFEGEVNEYHLANFTRLEIFSARRNKLILKVGPNWNPSFQKLNALYMESWNLGPYFPSWIKSLKWLEELAIPNTNISDSIPTWVWDAFPRASYFNFSNNNIYGDLSYTMKNPINVSYIYLASNHLSGYLPHISPDVFYMDLSNNLFFGSLDSFLCQGKGKQMGLLYLNLESNNLLGEIPDCWMMWLNLWSIKFDGNNFSGNLPQSLGSLPWLSSLRIRNNALSGNFPACLKNNTRLVFLDLSENQLSGIIPLWVGHYFLNLKVFLLRSNKFIGSIPKQICFLNSLQMLDLAENNLTGQIPKCISNLTAMLIANTSLESFILAQGNQTQYSITDVLLALKGRHDYYTFPGLIMSIDLSDNKLSGEIPYQITSLEGLQFLNLSNNLLQGEIPQPIGNMRSVQSIDLSKNKLYGEIPPTISNLNFLSELNLSYNYLTGKIPTGTQVQTFKANSFAGNDLCGPPLTTKCIDLDDVPYHGDNGKEIHYGNGVNWFYVSMSFGFVSGFWAVVGPLLYSRSWRYTYFYFLDRMWCKLQSFWW